MSRLPYFSPYASLSSSFNERAGPRISDSGDRRYHHRVVPVAQQAGAPHYAQSSALYPMEARSDSYNPHRYRPSESLDSGPTSLGGSPQFGQRVMIPVVHLGSNRETSGTPTSPLESGSGVVRSVGSPTPSTGSLTRPAPARKMQQATTDPEAEVDALTNVLMRSLETRPSSSGASSLISHETGTSSPVGSMCRGPGIQSPVGSAPGTLPGSRVNRLQQQQTSSSPVNGGGGGAGSPLTVGTGSPRTSSPTSSGSSTVGTGDPFQSNNCFRCRRPLVPPEGTTLGPPSTSNIVTLTGALAVRLHSTCFTCYLCRTPLASNAYYHSVHRLLCPTCVRDGAVESCANCKRPIGERIVRALGQPYHPNCFVCVVCNCRLDSKPFTVDVHERPLCLEDFHRRYAPRCAHCKRLIVPESGSREARRVVAGPNDYHLDCYRLSLVAAGSSSQASLPQQQPTSPLAAMS